MAYFITGGTGFIGRNFIDKLKDRDGDIYVLTRAASMHKFEELQERLGDSGDRLIPVTGDLKQPLLGVDEATIAELLSEPGSVTPLCEMPDESGAPSEPKKD